MYNASSLDVYNYSAKSCLRLTTCQDFHAEKLLCYQTLYLNVLTCTNVCTHYWYQNVSYSSPKRRQRLQKFQISLHTKSNFSVLLYTLFLSSFTQFPLSSFQYIWFENTLNKSATYSVISYNYFRSRFKRRKNPQK